MNILGSNGFDATKIEVSNNDFLPLSPGIYNAQITDVTPKVTKAGNGQYLSLQFTVTTDAGNERRVWANLNLVNPNPVAEDIAKKDLASICKAIGIEKLSDVQLLLGKKLAIKVAVDGDRNNIKGYKAIAGAQLTAAKPVLEAAQAWNDTDPDDMPWA
jgi:hypothetical protein